MNMPTKEAFDIAKKLGLNPKVKTANESVKFNYINTEASTWGKIIPPKKANK